MFARKVPSGTARTDSRSRHAVTRAPESLASAQAFTLPTSVDVRSSAGARILPSTREVDPRSDADRRSALDDRTAPPIVDDVLASPGLPLDAASRALAEPLFGRDFSQVRVHADGRAAESARAMDARAYTVGHHIVFAAGEAPASHASGRRLLLHELAHAVQQRHVVRAGVPLRISRPGDADERQADAAVGALLRGAPVPALGPSAARVARQPKAQPHAAAQGAAPVDKMAGAHVSQIIVWLTQRRVGFQTDRGWIFGSIQTDLTAGTYELAPDVRKRKWVVSKPAAQAGLRFSVNLEGALPWTLAYPATLPLTITAGAPQVEEGDIADIYGLGYNTIYKKAGPGSRAAVLALAALETSRLFVDLEAYKKLAAPLRKSILDLEPQAAGTGCAGWFDVMRANDPDFRPVLTDEQIRAGNAAYYESMREWRMQSRAAAAKKDAPTLDGAKVEDQWKNDKSVLVAAAQGANHGFKAEALHQIWVKYWADKVAIADGTLNAIIANEQRDHVDLSDTVTYRKAKQVNDLGLYLLADSVGALEICRTAEAMGKSLTLDELNERVISHSKFMEGMQVLALAVSLGPAGGGGPGATPRPRAANEPVKADPVVKTEPVAKTDPVTKTDTVAAPPKTGEKAEGGGRVVAGRAVKPRTASATKYVWNNPRMAKGNFVEAELSADGTLEVTVKSGGPDELRVGGSQMLDDVFEHFGADNIREFDAKWVRNSSFRENYDAYTQNIGKGMKPADAAWNTWTGRQLKARGFTRVEVPAHGADPEVVSPVFKR